MSLIEKSEFAVVLSWVDREMKICHLYLGIARLVNSNDIRSVVITFTWELRGWLIPMAFDLF